MPSQEQEQRQQHLILAENIALLSRLVQAPTAPYDNPRPSSAAARDPGRVLSFDTEVCLASTLAFLGSISDDPCHVIAVCVEEVPSTRSIQVVVAINKEWPDSQEGVLNRIQHGLTVVLGRLACVSEAEEAQVQESVIDAVADMCRQRILARVRSRRPDARYHRKKRQHAWLGSLLQRALEAVGRQGDRSLSLADLDTFKRRARRLLASLELLESCHEKDVHRHILAVLRAAHRLQSTGRVAAILSAIPTTDMEPTAVSAAAARVEKLARYWECSVYLVGLARSLGIFRRAEVIPVSLGPELFARDATPVPPDCLERCVERCKGRIAPLGFPRLEEIEKRLVARASLAGYVRQLLGTAKVHAEVQIVCRYELRPAAVPPRVICSGKNACYLCNLFVRLHGGGAYHLPGTHGNLYPGWRLPRHPSLQRTCAQLNRALEARVREALPRSLGPTPAPAAPARCGTRTRAPCFLPCRRSPRWPAPRRRRALAAKMPRRGGRGSRR
ncbi:hypothetical protein VTJ83DRAFT_2369 [Remersonia thermophila]|uniref:Uncharacterized protein n=1 Tax=Remersonia thermophila TaxID=72144 RepID=A0ABR4DII3_9PEZI